MTVATWFYTTFDEGAVLSKVIKDRTACLVITSFASVQAGLAFFGLNGWLCPFRHYLSCPCPGCGLTRATVSMFKGDFKGMVAYHALAPFFVVGLFIIAMGAVLPTQARKKLVSFVEKVEVRTGIGIVFCVVLISYWLVRLFIFTDSYMNLIMS
ncbi:MAG: hypothetical protein ACI9EW_001596 [Cellvibrionaceae bacterium]|jgi:hypothetical protein